MTPPHVVIRTRPELSTTGTEVEIDGARVPGLFGVRFEHNVESVPVVTLLIRATVEVDGVADIVFERGN